MRFEASGWRDLKRADGSPRCLGIMLHCFAVFCRQIYDVTDEVATNAYEDFWAT